MSHYHFSKTFFIASAMIAAVIMVLAVAAAPAQATDNNQVPEPFGVCVMPVVANHSTKAVPSGKRLQAGSKLRILRDIGLDITVDQALEYARKKTRDFILEGQASLASRDDLHKVRALLTLLERRLTEQKVSDLIARAEAKARFDLLMDIVISEMSKAVPPQNRAKRSGHQTVKAFNKEHGRMSLGKRRHYKPKTVHKPSGVSNDLFSWLMQNKKPWHGWETEVLYPNGR